MGTSSKMSTCGRGDCRKEGLVPGSASGKQLPRTRRQNTQPTRESRNPEAQEPNQKNSTHRQAGPGARKTGNPRESETDWQGIPIPRFAHLVVGTGPVFLALLPVFGFSVFLSWRNPSVVGSVPFRLLVGALNVPGDIPDCAYHMNTWEEKWKCSSLRLTHRTFRALRGVRLRLHRSSVGLLLLCCGFHVECYSVFLERHEGCSFLTCSVRGVLLRRSLFV